MMSLSIEATYSRNSGASAVDQVLERIAHSLRHSLSDPRLAAAGGPQVLVTSTLLGLVACYRNAYEEHTKRYTYYDASSLATLTFKPILPS